MPADEVPPDGSDALRARVEVLEAAVHDLRRLLILNHEAQPEWPRRLRDLRQTAVYAAAFVGDPLITVRVATYNRAALLCERALPSVMEQTYTNWEAVVVGDACTDDTAERVAALDDARIRYYNRPVNGPYPSGGRQRWLVAGTHAMNDAVEAANGAWIAPIDDDDEWTPDHLEVLLRAAQRHRAEVAYGAMRTLVGNTDLQTWFGQWPPAEGDFGFQAALYDSGLRDFRYDFISQFTDEVADWNMCRRMWDAGVRFVHLQRIVGTYWIAPDNDGLWWWQDRASSRPPHQEGPDRYYELHESSTPL